MIYGDSGFHGNIRSAHAHAMLAVEALIDPIELAPRGYPTKC